MTTPTSSVLEYVTPTQEPSNRKGGFDIYLGRQPIYDRELNVFGYELLYREGLQS